jgi:serine/threonine-protein kinase ATR
MRNWTWKRLMLLMILGGCLSAWSASAGPKPLFRDFMGLNGHTIQFRPQLYRPVAGLVRDYHPVEWDLGQDSNFITPFPMARNGVDWRTTYGSWHKEGWRTDASLMFETLPVAKWKKLGPDSFAYAERFARAFGPASTNALVETVEIGNEPGKFSDQDYRTVFENMARGLKAADPRLKVATCALTTGKSHDYAKSVDCIAGLEKYYDILNIHSYAELKGWPTWERSFPEDPRLKGYLGDVRRLCEWRDQHAPGKQVWITEFGYDATTRLPDPKTEFKQWVGVTETQQAQWTVRSWLTFATLPVDRAYLYFFDDKDDPQVHGSSGLTRNFLPKPAFHAVAHLQKTLLEYRFNKAVLEQPGTAMIYEFAHAQDARRRIWVAWSPTGEGKTTSLELPKFEGAVEHIECMPLVPGEAQRLSPEAGRIRVTESPVYMFLTLR